MSLVVSVIAAAFIGFVAVVALSSFLQRAFRPQLAIGLAVVLAGVGVIEVVRAAAPVAAAPAEITETSSVPAPPVSTVPARPTSISATTSAPSPTETNMAGTDRTDDFLATVTEPALQPDLSRETPPTLQSPVCGDAPPEWNFALDESFISFTAAIALNGPDVTGVLFVVSVDGQEKLSHWLGEAGKPSPLRSPINLRGAKKMKLTVRPVTSACPRNLTAQWSAIKVT